MCTQIYITNKIRKIEYYMNTREYVNRTKLIVCYWIVHYIMVAIINKECNQINNMDNIKFYILMNFLK